MRVGIIGGMGWIGSSLGRALVDGGRLAAGDLVILNRAGQRGDFFGHAVQWATGVADLVDRSDLIVVSVRPQDWPALQLDAKGKLVVSVMAGVPLAALPARCIRALPNAAAERRQSFTPWLAGPGCDAADRDRVVGVLSAIGQCAEVADEHQIDLMTATVGAGPAYLALMARAMIGFLVSEGVNPAVAEAATEGMICGAAPLLAGKMAEVEATLQVFMDYKGTTAAGLAMATARGFEAALQAGFKAGTDRAAEMGS